MSRAASASYPPNATPTPEARRATKRPGAAACGGAWALVRSFCYLLGALAVARGLRGRAGVPAPLWPLRPLLVWPLVGLVGRGPICPLPVGRDASDPAPTGTFP